MKFLQRTLFTGLVMAMAGQVSLAQDCNDPTTLCAEAGTTDVSPDGPALSLGCFDAQYTSVLQITTNSNVDPGSAIISVESFICDSMPDEVFVALVEYDGFAPCDQSSYTLVGDCASGTDAFELETPNLTTDTDYFIIIGSNADPIMNPCAASVSIAGSAVDIDACCDGTIPLGDPWELSVIGGSDPPGPGSTSYNWTPAEFLQNANTDSPTAFPEETTNYVVTGTVGDCQVTDIVTVSVGPPINIPNTITPNGDNVNDFWILSGIERFDAAEVAVFDRWGQQVHKSIGYPRPWDGTRDGTKLPTATYYYVIELNSPDVNIEPIIGSITLIH